MDITKALALCAERIHVKPKQAREMLADLPLAAKGPGRDSGRSGGGKPERNRDAENRRIVEKARAQLTHTLLLLC